MKHKINKTTAAMMAALLGTPLAALAQSQVTLSGVVDVGGRYTSNSNGSLTSVVSGSNSTSRLVIKTTEDLGGGMSANVLLDGSFAADSGIYGTNGQFFDRQSTVSLLGSWGEVRMGRDWHPMFRAWAATDPFGVLGVAAATTLWSAAPSTALSRAFGTNPSTLSRLNNALEYWLPAGLGGVYGSVMISPSEGGNAAGSFRYNGARLGYGAGPLDVAVSYGGTKIDASDAIFKQTGVSAIYDFGILKLSGSVIDSSYLGSKHRGIVFGASVPIGSGFLKASLDKAYQSGVNATGASISGNDAQLVGLGYEYRLSKRTAVYINAAHISNKGTANYGVPGGPAGVAPGSSSSGYDVGLRTSF